MEVVLLLSLLLLFNQHKIHGDRDEREKGERTRESGIERGEKEKELRLDDGGLPRRLLRLGGGVAGGGTQSKAGCEERKKATSRGFVHRSSTDRPVRRAGQWATEEMLHVLGVVVIVVYQHCCP